ncbi:MAG: NAD-dependent epimerase/dehydratase family protein [Pseudomonadota bacterium]|jgi:nucleoside-diphosphate-sugar epimerase|nr:NAD-dependent epimerase/dehydratase family protein [Pseudomonadota bacterium]
MIFTILGASGFIGRHLAAALRSEGHFVYAPTRDDSDVWRRQLGHVIYCIGLTADFRSRSFDTVRAHVSVLADVLERTQFESFVYLSSTRVYGKNADGSEEAPLIVDVIDPSDFYNLTKLTGESLCLSSGISGVKVARLSNVVGQDPYSDNFLSVLIREALQKRIVLQSHPASSKDYILLNDVVEILPRIAVGGCERLYNVASGVSISHREIVEQLTAITGCEKVLDDSKPLHHFPSIDIGRIRRDFNFTPRSVLDALPGIVHTARLESSIL